MKNYLWKQIILNHDWAVKRYMAQNILSADQIRTVLERTGIPERAIGPRIGKIYQAAIPEVRAGGLDPSNAGVWLKQQTEI